MAKQKSKRKKYSFRERRAYNIGLGAGLAGAKREDASALFDVRQGRGQNVNECNAARAGYFQGLKNRYGAIPFAKNAKDRKLH